MVRVLLLGLVLSAAIGCGDGADPEDVLYERAKVTLGSAGAEAAVAELYDGNDPVEATRALFHLALHLHVEEKDLSRALVVGRMGIGAATAKASDPATDPATAIAINSCICTISSGLAYMAWPGSARLKGVRIRGSDVEVGRRAAQHAVKLAQELELAPGELARAYWMLGAHLMLEGEGEPVDFAFREARRLGDDAHDQLVHGTRAVGMARSRGDRGKARARFDEALQALEEIGGSKAEGYAEDLRVAWRMLVPDEAVGETVTWTAGPITFEFVPARAAQHFAIVTHLARGLYPADAFPLVDEDRRRLDRFAGLLARKPGLGRFFLTREAPTAALFDAAGAGLITPREVTDLSEMFRSLRDRIAADLAGRRLAGEDFAASLDRERLEAIAVKASKFTKVKSLTVEVWPIPAEPGMPRCRFEDGRIVVEVNRKADPTADLVYGMANAFLARREKDIRPALEEVMGQVGSDLPDDVFLDALAALIVEGGAAAEARNTRGPILLEAIRLTMEMDGWSLNYEDPDPLAAFLREATTLHEVTGEPK